MQRSLIRGFGGCPASQIDSRLGSAVETSAAYRRRGLSSTREDTRRRSAINPTRVNSVSEAVAYRVAACAEAARDYRRLVVSRLAPEESQV